MGALRRHAIAIAALALVLTACGNAGDSDDGGGASGDAFDERAGVTDSTIRIGAVIAETSPIGNFYAGLSDGIEAYAEFVNAQGGVHGREFELVSVKDDQNSQARNAAAVRAVVEEDQAFAVMISSPNFGGADYLVEHAIPTFGWNINPEWSNGPNLFGEKGSFLDFDGAGPLLPWLATELGHTKVGTMSYSHVQSANCAKGQKNSYSEYGDLELVYENSSLQFGFSDLTADVERMRDAGLEFLSTCMDSEGNAKVADAIAKAGLDIEMYWPQGYDRDFLSAFADAAEGVYFGIAFEPFELDDHSEGMQNFLDQMDALGKQPTEVRLAGWISMDMLHRGIEEAGEDFTRSSVVETINSWTDYTADGIRPPIDWTVQHEATAPLECTAFVRAEDGQFVPQFFGEADKPFVCFPGDAASIDEVEFRSFA